MRVQVASPHCFLQMSHPLHPTLVCQITQPPTAPSLQSHLLLEGYKISTTSDSMHCVWLGESDGVIGVRWQGGSHTEWVPSWPAPHVSCPLPTTRYRYLLLHYVLMLPRRNSSSVCSFVSFLALKLCWNDLCLVLCSKVIFLVYHFFPHHNQIHVV